MTVTQSRQRALGALVAWGCAEGSCQPFRESCDGRAKLGAAVHMEPDRDRGQPLPGIYRRIERHQVIGRDGRQFGEVHHDQTLRLLPFEAKPAGTYQALLEEWVDGPAETGDS